ncbi:MAG: twin-arginine translocation signal domain-containing protein [Candidatus Hydrogenedentes bacterium]|nr:twin-arginine translocation signal domain-containing protein [Candidatus Hydrogenedentota bacterium]
MSVKDARGYDRRTFLKNVGAGASLLPASGRISGLTRICVL